MSLVAVLRPWAESAALPASDRLPPDAERRSEPEMRNESWGTGTGKRAALRPVPLARPARRSAAARTRTATPLVLPVVAAIVLTVVAGCRQQAPLTIEPRYVDLGLVRRGGTEVTVTLQAWQRGSVKILDFTSFGTSVTPLESLVGQVLQKGERKTVTLMVTGNGSGFEQWFVWSIRTDPPGPTTPAPRVWGTRFFRPFSKKPVRKLPVSTLVMRGRFFPPPWLTPRDLRLLLPVGREHECTVELVGIRPSEEAPIEVRVVPLTRTPITLVPVRRGTEVRVGPGGSSVVQDVRRLKLRVPGTLPLGQHVARFRLDVGRRWQPPVLNVLVRVVEPLLFDQTTLFAGALNPGRAWDYTLHYQELVPGADEDVQAVSESDWLEAELDPTHDVLKLKAVAPGPGRFEGHVRIDFGDKLPPIRIKVAGIGLGPPSAEQDANGGK